MSTLTKYLLPLAMIAMLSVLPAQSDAGIIIEYYESGSDVVLEYSGSLNFSRQLESSTAILNAWGNQQSSSTQNPVFYSSPSGYRYFGTFDVVSATDDSFWAAGRGVDLTGNSSTGDTLLFRFNSAFVQKTVDVWLEGGRNYTAGDSISGSLTLGGESIASTGIENWAVDMGNIGTIEFRSRNMVPEPTTLTIFASMIGLTAIRRRRS